MGYNCSMERSNSALSGALPPAAGGHRPRRLRVGLAGLGMLGSHHAYNLAHRVAMVDLVRVVDVDQVRAEAIAAELGAEWSVDYSDLVEDAGIDAVVIATPTALHPQMIIAAARAGKHIFCEKPIALTFEESVEAVRIVQEAGIVFQVGFHRRYDPSWRDAHERIKRGELGSIYYFHTSQRDSTPPPPSYIEIGGEHFVDATVHDFDLARWLVGEITELTAVTASVTDPQFEENGDLDHAVVVLRFENGALGVIDNSRAAAYGYECSTEILGSQATVRIGRDHRATETVWLTAGGAMAPNAVDFRDRHREAYITELNAFVAAVRTGSPDGHGARATDAVIAFQLAKLASKSSHESRTVRLGRHHTAIGTLYREVDPG
jgi:predicted dehydrogenase